MILVTGGAGFIGKHLVRALIAAGERVRIFDNYSRSEGLMDVECIQGDIRDLKSVLYAAEGCDEIIHLAYINGTKTFYEKPALVLDVGVRGMINVLCTCKEYSIKKFILMSSSEVCRYYLVDVNEHTPLVIPDPFNPRYSYSAGKIISEMMAIHSDGLFERLLIARPFNIYGPGMAPGHVIPDFIEQAKKIKIQKCFSEFSIPFEIIGSGEETRSFCYIDDFVDGFMLMRERGEHKGIYNIGTSIETTIRELAEMVLAIFIPGFFCWIKQSDNLREGDLPRRKPDIGKLTALGYNPKIKLEEGLRRMIQ